MSDGNQRIPYQPRPSHSPSSTRPSHSLCTEQVVGRLCLIITMRNHPRNFRGIHLSEAVRQKQQCAVLFTLSAIWNRGAVTSKAEAIRFSKNKFDKKKSQNPRPSVLNLFHWEMQLMWKGPEIKDIFPFFFPLLVAGITFGQIRSGRSEEGYIVQRWVWLCATP